MNLNDILTAKSRLGKLKEARMGATTVNEFAPGNGNDEGDNDNALFKYAKMWYNGDEQTQDQIAQILAKHDWEIGEIESEEGGAFVVKSGDENGNTSPVVA